MNQKLAVSWATANLNDSEEMTDLSAALQRKARQNAAAAFEALVAQGILDGDGNLTDNDLPADMQHDAKRDFGG